MNDAKMEIKRETIRDEEEDWGDYSSPHLILLRIGMRRHNPLFYIPIRRTINDRQWGL